VKGKSLRKDSHTKKKKKNNNNKKQKQKQKKGKEVGSKKLSSAP
jgi:hypothetical protein